MVRRAAGFRLTASQTGEFRATISIPLNNKLNEYCNAKKINKSVYINWCVEKCLTEDLEKLKREKFQIYSKEELIDMLLKEEEACRA